MGHHQPRRSVPFGIDGETISSNSGDEQVEDQREMSEGKNFAYFIICWYIIKTKKPYAEFIFVHM